MKTCNAFIAFAALVFWGCRDTTVVAPGERQLTPVQSRVVTPAEGRHLFLLHGDVPSDFATRVAALGGSVFSSMPQIGVVVTEGLTDDDARIIAGNDDVTRDLTGTWVPAPDEMLPDVTGLSASAEIAETTSPFAAEYLPSQWDMFQIHAPEAWASTTGTSKVRVAILDSGLDPDHVDQQGLIDAASSVAFVPSTEGLPSWVDDNLHGTFVGGIVTSNNIGTAGVAPNVTLVAVKVIDAEGSGTVGATIAGIYYATNIGVQIINMSLGLHIPKNAPGASTLLSAMNRAVNYAKSHGVLVVSAAGNDATDLQHDHDFIELPCEAGVQLCVSATGIGDVFEGYSNFGTNAVEVAAPGGDALEAIHGLCSSHAANPRAAQCKDGQHYLFAFGTSAAAPHASGLAAYLDSHFGGALSPSQLIALISQYADDLGKPGADPFFGMGRINVIRSLTAPQP